MVIFPYAVQRILVTYLFYTWSLCFLVLNTYLTPFPFFSSLVNTSLFSLSVSLFLFYYIYLFVLSFRFLV